MTDTNEDSLTFLLGCDPQVEVTIKETSTGTLFVKVSSVGLQQTGEGDDIDGVFFNLASDGMIGDLVIFPEANEGTIFSPVTAIQANVNSVNTLSNGAQVQENYDVGIQFGLTDGSTAGGVYDANFTLYSQTGPLTLDDIDPASFTAVVESDGGNGQVLTTGDTAGGGVTLVEKEALFEDFNQISDPADSSAIVRDGGWEIVNGKLYTDGSNDGVLKLAPVESDGPVSIMFDAKADHLENFEASGKNADSLRLQVRLEDGKWQTLDTFKVNAAKTALVGNKTGNEITGQESTLNYEGGILDQVDGAVEFRFKSDISASNEQITIDDIKVTATEAVAAPTPTPDPVLVKTESFAEDFDHLARPDDSDGVDRADGWDVKGDALYTDGHNDGVLEFAPQPTDGPACFTFDAKVNCLNNFEASGNYADSLQVQVNVDGQGWTTLDTFVVNDDKSALVGSQTGNEITQSDGTLSYSGGLLDEAEQSVEFRFISDISASDEKIMIDNVSIETSELIAVPEGEPVKVDFEKLGTGEGVDGQYDGVTISAQRAGDSQSSENDAMVFDSENPTGGDRDLAFDDQGNILIISEDNDGGDPDDNAHGGTITLDFDAPSTVMSLDLLDIEERGGTIDLFGENGELMRTVEIPTTGDNGAQQLDIDAADVSSMNVNFVGSGAIDNLCFVPPKSGDCDAQYDVGYVGGIPILPPVTEDVAAADQLLDLEDDLMV